MKLQFTVFIVIYNCLFYRENIEIKMFLTLIVDLFEINIVNPEHRENGLVVKTYR